MPIENDEKKIKDEVKKFYGQAISTVDQGGTCCGGGNMIGQYASLSGYTPEQLETLPSGLNITSFGCGNPVDLLNVKKGDTVLDLGSGAGLDLLLAAEKVGPEGRVIGVDMTPSMIARARENISRAGAGNVEVRPGEMENLPVEDNSIDWIISNCVINLSPDKEKVFAEIYRVLKPGGRMLVSDIVTTAQLPDSIRSDSQAWSGCLGGALLESDYLRVASESGLTDVKVVGRHDYDKNQIALFASGCCHGQTEGVTEALIDELAGKVSSVKVSTQKPFK